VVNETGVVAVQVSETGNVESIPSYHRDEEKKRTVVLEIEREVVVVPKYA